MTENAYKPAETMADAASPPSNAAVRMRAYRRRRRRGMRCFSIRLTEPEIEALVTKNYLGAEARSDREAIVGAIEACLSDTLAGT